MTTREHDASALRAENLQVEFGGVRAADGLTFNIAQGELVGMIGPNGAGKTSAIRLITGVYHPSAGDIYLHGKRINALPIDERARSGLAHTHQIVRPLRGMTVLDNVAVAVGKAQTRNPLRALVSLDRSWARDKAFALLQRVGLDDVADRDCAILPLGRLKRLEMARALGLEPTVILLDEPLAGLNSGEAAQLAETIVEVNAEGLTVILVEHNLGEVLRVAHRLMVLVKGRIVGDGPPQEIVRSAIVRDSYLGTEEASDA